ncbi:MULTISPECIES: hypothetical protein [unclassified Arthrobacter]|uniref:hypothetical protein n=1 Tax=unclassified Arthrobacter TaxID=235627 RepID=UPI00159E9C31|nr:MULTISPECIES: hypothetical protein [unclassified Arthrobacter]MCQ9164792.1 hypothetical protein [Arthrobacter sp. STN4]NVM98760.1 hypothetical protein [Arthrobacter sp. SDTb3-6]
MEFEVRAIPGCPHGASARVLFADALTLEGLGPAAPAVREIDTDEDAAALRFHGSPTFTIDGKDLFPVDTEPAVTCRVYATPDGLAGQPGLETLRGAIRAAVAGSAGSAG